MLIPRRATAVALLATMVISAAPALGGTANLLRRRTTSHSRTDAVRDDYVTRAAWPSDDQRSSNYQTPQRGRPDGGVPGSPGSLPGGRRYYGGR